MYSQVIGVWGAIGNAERQLHLPRISGTGLLQVAAGPVVGDYNNDGTVDSADYVTWRRQLGAATIINRDPNNAGAVGQADFLAWRTHFGQTGVTGSGAAQQVGLDAAVPEPATGVLSLLSLAAILRRRCRSCRTRS